MEDQTTSPATKDGVYYVFDCMNAFLEGKLFPSSVFTKEEAIETASNYEARLIEVIVKEGEVVSYNTIYDPFNCFD